MTQTPGKTDFWRAVIADQNGYVMTDEQIGLWCAGDLKAYSRQYGGDAEPSTLYVVTGEAQPEPQSDLPDEQFFRVPNPLAMDDVLYELDLFNEDEDRIQSLWRRAVDTAAAMNAAGVA